MKNLLWLALLLPTFAKAQINGTIQKTVATGVVRGAFGSLGVDSLAVIYGIGVNGQILVYNSTLKKYVPTTGANLYVPYTGATANVDLGFWNFKTTGTTDLSLLKYTGAYAGIQTFASNIFYSGHTTLLDATLAARQFTLPAASSSEAWDATNTRGKIFTIKKVDASANLVNIVPDGTDLIDGGGTIALDAQWQSVALQSTGTAWRILSRYSQVTPIANGGTGSATQNFVDLTTNQTVGGAKTFTSNPIINQGAGVSKEAFISYTGTNASSVAQTLRAGVNVSATDGSYGIKNSVGNGLSITTDGNLSASGAFSAVSGTFSGALTGTSATFSGNGAFGGSSFSGLSNGISTNTTVASGSSGMTMQLSGALKGFVYVTGTQTVLESIGSVSILGTSISLNSSLTGTSATFSGLINSTVSANAVLTATAAATTSRLYQQYLNTGGEALFGIESSTGSSLIAGASAYSTVLGTQTGRSLHLVTAGAVRYTIDASGNNTWTGSGIFGGPVRLKGYTVATLPAGTQGDTTFATDTTVVTAKGVAPVGGGTNISVLFHNGTAWVGI